MGTTARDVRLMTHCHLADFDRQRYFLFLSSHTLIIPYLS